MKKISVAVALAVVLFVTGCAQGAVLPGAASGVSMPENPTETTSGWASSGSAASSIIKGEYPYEQELLSLVNSAFEGYRVGRLPEPVRYNTDYNGINNSPPPGVALPENVTRDELEYWGINSEVTPNFITTSLALDDDYTMGIHVALDNSMGEAKPSQVVGVYFYDKLGAGQVAHAEALNGGNFMNLKSDRLFASADFENVRTATGRVSGSISWGKANRFLWVNIDSMKTPFFYTYFVGDDGVLLQDYPQKDWQRSEVVSDDKMLLIAQSLLEQLVDVLGKSDLLV